MRPTTGLLIIALFTVSLPTQATLYDRGGGLIYDDVLSVTWLQDANYADTSGYTTPGGRDVTSLDGYMSWYEATTWAADLNYNGITGWRLPKTGPVNGNTYDATFSYIGSTDGGFNISASGSAYPGTTSSELAYMYYVNLGNTGHVDPSGGSSGCAYGLHGCLENTSPFINLLPYLHWSGSTYAELPNTAWYFSMNGGDQYANSMGWYGHAWAVHDGDVAAVPEADTWAMLLAGLGFVGWAARRRKQAKARI